MAADATKARRRAIVERLWTWLDNCLILNDYETYTLSMNKDFPVHRAKVMPLITIALGEHRLDSQVYGRLMPQKGMTAMYPFTLFIYHWKTDDPNHSHNYDVHILTDLIVKYMRSKSGSSTEMIASGIFKMDDITTRESDPVGMRALSRMILSGTISAKREDVV